MLPKNLQDFLDSVDLQDNRDYIYEDVYMKEYWDWKKVWPIWDELVNKIYDQFDQESTYKACGGYSLWIIYNWNNIIEYQNKGFKFEQENPKTYRHIFQNKRWRPNRWSKVTEILKFFRDVWLIEWRMIATTIGWLKNAIENWFLVMTGTQHCDRRKASKKKEYVYSKNYWWHFFDIIWYDKKWRIAANSFGTDRWDMWYFKIPYKYTKYLFQRRVVVDKDDKGIIENLNFAREYKEAIDLWITNWTDPNKPATKKEVSVMIYRSLQIK